jgi:hypothetical protein
MFTRRSFLQVKLDRRFGSLYMESNYTWSKALANAFRLSDRRRLK